MVGVAGSGKTTWSKEYVKKFPNNIRLSTDECRAIAGVSEGDQTVSHVVFNSIYLITEHLLKQGRDVIIDATNYNRKSRKRFVDIAKKTNSTVGAVMVGGQLSISALIQRNNNRDRKVPEDVIKRQHTEFQIPHIDEGFDALNLVENNELVPYVNHT
jgi:predicted kinase